MSAPDAEMADTSQVCTARFAALSGEITTLDLTADVPSSTPDDSSRKIYTRTVQTKLSSVLPGKTPPCLVSLIYPMDAGGDLITADTLDLSQFDTPMQVKDLAEVFHLHWGVKGPDEGYRVTEAKHIENIAREKEHRRRSVLEHGGEAGGGAIVINEVNEEWERATKSVDLFWELDDWDRPGWCYYHRRSFDPDLLLFHLLGLSSPDGDCEQCKRAFAHLAEWCWDVLESEDTCSYEGQPAKLGHLLDFALNLEGSESRRVFMMCVAECVCAVPRSSYQDWQRERGSFFLIQALISAIVSTPLLERRDALQRFCRNTVLACIAGTYDDDRRRIGDLVGDDAIFAVPDKYVYWDPASATVVTDEFIPVILQPLYRKLFGLNNTLLMPDQHAEELHALFDGIVSHIWDAYILRPRQHEQKTVPPEDIAGDFMNMLIAILQPLTQQLGELSGVSFGPDAEGELERMTRAGIALKTLRSILAWKAAHGKFDRVAEENAALRAENEALRKELELFRAGASIS